MATNPKYLSYRLTDAELYGIIAAYFGKASGVNSPATVAFAIVRAESDGVVNAYRPASQNTLGGDDRGIWQWNSKAHPDIKEAQAFDPNVATMFAATKSARGQNWGAWNYGPNAYSGTSRRLDLDTAWRTIAPIKDRPPSLSEVGAKLDAERAKQPDVGGAQMSTDTGPAAGVFDAVLEPVKDAVSGLADWAAPLAGLLRVLADPTWWRRIGIGALGVVLVIAMIVIYNREAMTGAAVGAAIPGPV